MLRRNTVVILLLFVALVAAVVILQRTGRLDPAATETPVPTRAAIFQLDTGDTVRLQIESSTGERVVYQKTENNAWMVAEPVGRQELAETIETTVNQIQGWTVTNELSTAPALDEIGLAVPLHRITLTSGSGQDQVLDVGQITPTGSGYYVRLNGGQPFVVSKFSVDPVLEVVKATPTPAAPLETLTP